MRELLEIERRGVTDTLRTLEQEFGADAPSKRTVERESGLVKEVVETTGTRWSLADASDFTEAEAGARYLRELLQRSRGRRWLSKDEVRVLARIMTVASEVPDERAVSAALLYVSGDDDDRRALDAFFALRPWVDAAHFATYQELLNAPIPYRIDGHPVGLGAIPAAPDLLLMWAIFRIREALRAGRDETRRRKRKGADIPSDATGAPRIVNVGRSTGGEARE